MSVWEGSKNVRQPGCGALDALGHALLRVRAGCERSIGECHEDVRLCGQDMISPFVRCHLRGKKRKDDEPRENRLTTGDIKESSRPCLAYAAQTESGDKVITIRGHVSIVRGVPE